MIAAPEWMTRPFKKKKLKLRRVRVNQPKRNASGAVILSYEDFTELLSGALEKGAVTICDECDAWLVQNDEALVVKARFKGCKYAYTSDSNYRNLCRKYRGSIIRKSNALDN